MTLFEVIRRLESAAQAQPDVYMIVPGDVYRLNAVPDAKYGVFAWTQGTHSVDARTGLSRYQFTLFFVDRLTADKRNEVLVQSAGIGVLNNILQAVAEDLGAEDWTFTPFNYRFADECAGVFCSVTFTVPLDTMCAYDYADIDGQLYTAEGWKVIDLDGFSIIVKL